jgi:hypothetical protein
LKNIKITIVIYFLGITSTAVYAINISLTADNFTPGSPGDVVLKDSLKKHHLAL